VSYLVIGLVAFAASAMTLFSGFGLGTLLLPTFALFLPVEMAVSATAVVHGANSLFKASILWRNVDRAVLVRFGLPAIGAALVGAALLGLLSGRAVLLRWQLGALPAEVTPIKLVMGGLILAFAVVDLAPRFERLRFERRWLPLGGAISGFFGGLSGHQGALRAAFLVPLGLKPEAFAATQAVLAAMVDSVRISVYVAAFLAGRMPVPSGREEWLLVGVAVPCAFGGALLGRSMLPKVTLGGVRRLTGLLLLIVGLALVTGLV
jgi:uncharacterized membrane protein YfcA